MTNLAAESPPPPLVPNRKWVLLLPEGESPGAGTEIHFNGGNPLSDDVRAYCAASVRGTGLVWEVGVSPMDPPPPVSKGVVDGWFEATAIIPLLVESPL